MRRSLLVSILLCVMLMLTAPVQAGRVLLEDGMVVDYHPDTLTLEPGERGTVELEIRNSGNETRSVALTHLAIRSPGASGATIDPDFFELAVGESQVVIVVIESYASYQDNGISDSHILIEWGHNLTLVDGRVDRTTVEGETTIIIRVIDDFAARNSLIAVSIVGVAVIIVAVAVLHGRIGRNPPHEER